MPFFYIKCRDTFRCVCRHHWHPFLLNQWVWISIDILVTSAYFPMNEVSKNRNIISCRFRSKPIPINWAYAQLISLGPLDRSTYVQLFGHGQLDWSIGAKLSKYSTIPNYFESLKKLLQQMNLYTFLVKRQIVLKWRCTQTWTFT